MPNKLELHASVIMKDKHRGGITLFIPERGEMLEVNGDAALMLLVLAERRFSGAGLNVDELIKLLAKRSNSFAANRNQLECISESAAYFRSIGILK